MFGIPFSFLEVAGRIRDSTRQIWSPYGIDCATNHAPCPWFCPCCSPMLSHRSSMLPLGPWTAEVGISWVLASRFTSFNVIVSSSVALCMLTVWLVFGAAFVPEGSLNFGGTFLATEHKAIKDDRSRNLRFICVYQVQLESTLEKTSCLHCRLARWKKGCPHGRDATSSQFVCP